MSSQVTNQEKLLMILERVSEPLYLSPRGSSNVFFSMPMDGLCETKKKAMSDLRKGMKMEHSRVVTVQMPQNMPDLSRFGAICPKKGNFLYFLSSHRALGEDLKQILMAERSMDNFFNMACVCRDSPMINPQLFVYAFTACVLQRPDMRTFRLPPFYEMMPDHFIEGAAISAAQEVARFPNNDRTIVMLNGESAADPSKEWHGGTTGRNSNPENRLWYFREDIGANSHHFHWHVVFGGNTVKFPQRGSRHRRGELFYYMHHSMIARYDAERLSVGLARVKPITLENPVVKEAYFGKLYSTNSGKVWGTRQENTELTDVDRTEDGERLNVSLEELKRWRDRILEAIDSGYILTKDEKGNDIRKKLTTFDGVDMLGDMIENSETLSPNLKFYGPGGFHNMGHVLIAFSQDPRFKYKENAGPMGDTSTALRDPAFYRWHKYIDILFDQWKIGLEPYTYTDANKEFPLTWKNVTIQNAQMKNSRQDIQQSNILSTFWMMSDIDLARGIDFGRTSALMLGPVWGRFTHLQYDKFNYIITVDNQTGKPSLATVRIFMAPRFDEHGDQLALAEQRLLFFELDKFATTLKPGVNNITRSSTESSVTIPWESSFRQLENLNREKEMADIPANEGICGCGWPQHLLLPRGTPEGMKFDVVVFLTNGEDDKPSKGSGLQAGNDKTKCRQAMSFCGILDEMFPDAKPMGYPFDRFPFGIPDEKNPNAQPMPPKYIETYAAKVPNMMTFQVMIVHQPKRFEVRPQLEGDQVATIGMETMDENGECGKSMNKNPKEKGGRNIPDSPRPKNPNNTRQNPRYNPNSTQHGWNNKPNHGYRQGRDPQQDEPEDWEDVGNEDFYQY